MNDARAKDAWVSLGTANPDDVKIQWAVLGARGVQTDHVFIGQTLDRLVALLGEGNATLDLTRARWLLQGQSADKDTTQASILLSDITRSVPGAVAPHLLLAACYMRMGNLSGAIDQLTSASDLQPDRADIAIELARLLQGRGDFAQARQYIDRAAGSKTAPPEDVRRAAALLAVQGDYTAALSLLNKTSAQGDKQPPDLLLAALYRQLGQPGKTDEICRTLLEKPDAGSISFSADFYAAQNRPEDAEHALSLLDSLKLPDGQKELILANFAVRHGTPEEALKQFQAAVHAAPKDAAAWNQLVTYSLATGKVDDALGAADQAAQALTGPAAFDTLRQNAALVREAGKIPATRELLTLLGAQDANTSTVLEALRTVVAAANQKEAPAQTVAKLEQLANRSAPILPLQILMLQLYMNAGQTERAVDLATRTIQAFPTAAESLRMATNVMESAQQWNQSLSTAEQWRRTDSANSVDADLAIAVAEMHLGDSAAASKQIEPYLQNALADPDKYSGVILMRAQLLLASHHAAQAESLLVPLLAKSPQWRNVWMTLAIHTVDDPKTAAAWLNRVSALTNDPNEQTALAMAWSSLGDRAKDASFRTNARNILEKITQSPGATATAWVAWGKLNEADGNWTGAANAYGQALQKAPDSAVPLNNLAYALVKNHGDLNEAQALIAKALKLLPNQPAAAGYAGGRDGRDERLQRRRRGLEAGTRGWIKRTSSGKSTCSKYTSTPVSFPPPAIKCSRSLPRSPHLPTSPLNSANGLNPSAPGSSSVPRVSRENGSLPSSPPKTPHTRIHRINDSDFFLPVITRKRQQPQNIRTRSTFYLTLFVHLVDLRVFLFCFF